MILVNKQLRNPYKLINAPFAFRLSLHKFYQRYHPVTEIALNELYNDFISAASSYDFESLINGELHVNFEDDVRITTLRMTNSQYAVFDKSNIEYTYGYEPSTALLIDNLTSDKSVFCDIGANWGYFTAYLASKKNFQGIIHSFEPVPSSFSDLTQLVTDLNLGDRVQVYNKALSDTAGEVNMTIPNNFSGMAKISDGYDVRGITVSKIRLDDAGISDVDLIKIDVEGHEREVILGAISLINNSKPYILFEDAFDQNKYDNEGDMHISNILARMGYELFLARWLRSDGSLHPLLVGDTSAQKLALIPINYPVGRKICPELTNLVACHKSKIDKLKEALEN